MCGKTSTVERFTENVNTEDVLDNSNEQGCWELGRYDKKPDQLKNKLF